jgi:hypothetical protein
VFKGNIAGKEDGGTLDDAAAGKERRVVKVTYDSLH